MSPPRRPQTSPPVVYVLDAHFQIFRAYHSLPDLRSPAGEPVGAVRGYTQVLIKFLRDYEPTHVAAAFDFAMTSFRNRIYAGYKAGRTEAPADLEPQFALCERATAALGIPLYQLEDYEADDLIASLVRQLRAQGAEVVIVTRDKDLAALVSDHVRLLDLKDGTESGPKEVEARLGVPPTLVPEYLTLVGDAVDGIPGIPGVGAKTGAALLQSFGGIDAIPCGEDALRDAGIRAPARVARALAENAELLSLSRALVAMRDDLSIEARIEQLAYRGADRGQLEALLGELGAERLISRVVRWQP